MKYKTNNYESQNNFKKSAKNTNSGWSSFGLWYHTSNSQSSEGQKEIYCFGFVSWNESSLVNTFNHEQYILNQISVINRVAFSYVVYYL